jgi:7,8-dihydro-6-hydroxymethylpterin-pyrophosphokinase
MITSYQKELDDILIKIKGFTYPPPILIERYFTLQKLIEEQKTLLLNNEESFVKEINKQSEHRSTN